ncbi:hypothetical protein [Priestia megaterium]|uniref:Uncharacterized protein n=1 Tax=Priestia megaterium TaxID=1404 RepID=A0A6M6DN03_PRIMG|nr:hypothetical protein [Priestia megaterium]QJX74736.1 hypothetical protein FDZ14_00525 [Priestia megaterium]
MTHVELQFSNCKNVEEIKVLVGDILGAGAWEKLSQSLLEEAMIKNWKEQKDFQAVINDIENSKINNAFDASVKATIIEKIENAK